MESSARLSRILIILAVMLLGITARAQVTCENMKRSCSETYHYYEMAAAACRSQQQAFSCDGYKSDSEFAPMLKRCTPEALCRDATILNDPRGLDRYCVNVTEKASQVAACAKSLNCMKQVPYATLVQLGNWEIGLVKGIYGLFAAEHDLVYNFTSTPGKAAVDTKSGGAEYNRRWQCLNAVYHIGFSCRLYGGTLNAIMMAEGLKAVPEMVVKSSEAVISLHAAIRSAPAFSTVERNAFVKRLLGRQITTTADRTAYAALAQRLVPDGKTLFVDVENAEMKNLNDFTGDKNLVTALTNRRLQIMFERLSALKKKYPGVKFAQYDDFKSGRVAFEAVDGGQLPTGFADDVARSIQQANHDFAAEMVALGIAEEAQDAAKKKSKPLPPADQWFTAGMGGTADMASKAERQARTTRAVGNRVRSFDDPIMQRNMAGALRTTENVRAGLAQTSLKNTSLLTKTSSGKLIPSIDVFESYRKTSSAAEFARDVEARTGVKITNQMAQNLRNYIRDVDGYSPSLLLVDKRQTVSFKDSKANGIMVDINSMGARNLSKAAEALADAKNPADAVILNRQGERAATAGFNADKDAIVKAGNAALAEMGIRPAVSVSGDDIMFQPHRALTSDEMRRVQTAIARSSSVSNVRLSAVGAGVRGADIVGVRGELLEKYITGKTMGQIPNQANYIKMVISGRDGSAVLSVVTRDGAAVPAEVERLYQASFAEALLKVK